MSDTYAEERELFPEGYRHTPHFESDGIQHCMVSIERLQHDDLLSSMLLLDFYQAHTTLTAEPNAAFGYWAQIGRLANFDPRQVRLYRDTARLATGKPLSLDSSIDMTSTDEADTHAISVLDALLQRSSITGTDVPIRTVITVDGIKWLLSQNSRGVLQVKTFGLTERRKSCSIDIRVRHLARALVLFTDQQLQQSVLQSE